MKNGTYRPSQSRRPPASRVAGHILSLGAEMDEAVIKAFGDFWDRVGQAKHEIRSWMGPRAAPGTEELMDDEWFELYEVMRPALQPFAKKRHFSVPPEAPGYSVFEAETALEALMFFLNPPEALVGLHHVLDDPQYLQIERDAQQECRMAFSEYEKPVSANVQAPSPEIKKDAEDEQAKPRPRWDEENQELWYGQVVCRRFRRAAENQTAILRAFEAAGWPKRVLDPLETGPENAHRQQTSDAVYALNKAIMQIRFELAGDLLTAVQNCGNHPAPQF